MLVPIITSLNASGDGVWLHAVLDRLSALLATVVRIHGLSLLSNSIQNWL